MREVVIEEIGDFYEGDFPTLPELRAEASRWMAAFGWEPFRRDGPGVWHGRPRLDDLCHQLWTLAVGMSLEELFPAWASDQQLEDARGQEAVLTVYLGPLIQAMKDVEDHWLALFDGLPPLWHPVQYQQYSQAFGHMVATDFRSDRRLQLEAQLRRAERHAPDARQLELFPE
jgi:hypothetical protein